MRLTKFLPFLLCLVVIVFNRSAQAARTITINTPDNFAPDKRVPFTVGGENIDGAELRVWHAAGGLGAEPKRLLRQVYQRYQQSKHVGEGLTFYVPLLEPGLYMAEARHGLLVQTTYLRVTDIGLVTKRAPRELLVYAVRLTSGQPYPGATLRIADAGLKGENGKWLRHPGLTRTIVTGRDGVAQLANTPANGDLRVAATQGGSFTQTEAPLADQEENENKVLFYTERPIYRPGQKVYFKGIVRRDLSIGGQRANGNIYTPVSNRPVHVSITDAANNKLTSLSLKTNAMGTFAGLTELIEDAPIGRYTVEINVLPLVKGGHNELFYGRFAVQAYRKPEYEVIATPMLDPLKSWATQGEPFDIRVRARYFFGGPVADGVVKYNGDASGEMELDANGEALVHYENPRAEVEGDATSTFHFQVTDSTNRIVETSAEVFAPWSDIKPSLEFDRYAYKLQNTAKIKITTADPIGRPVSAKANVRLFYYRKNRIKHPDSLRVDETIDEVEFWNGAVQTDASGLGELSVRLGRSGYLKAQVATTDSRGRVSHHTEQFWVLGPNEHDYYGYDFPELHVAPDRDFYKPGDLVRVLIVTNRPGRTALITLEGDRIWTHQLFKLTEKAMLFEFRFPLAAAPGAHLSVGFPRGSEWQSSEVYIKAQDKSKKLDIKITPAKPEYRPGETAQYTIAAHDGLGHPAAAEISLSFVDKALYSLAADETPEPFEFFYGPRPLRVATTFFLPRELEGGSYQRIERPVPVRQKFEDTAYWNPFVVTDAKGLATLKFPLPDNLTTWRATARGISADTKAGVANQETLVTKPLLVRLTLPRFYTQDDNAQALVVVNNNGKQAQAVRVSLHSEGASLTPVGEEVGGAQRGVVEAGHSQTFRWTVKTAEVPVGGLASFTATAWADAPSGTPPGDSTDAMKLSLPVYPHGIRTRSWQAGMVAVNAPSGQAKLPQPAGMIRNASRLDINFSPSLAGPMLAALPQLQGYPYGCTEQTLSRFVPTVVAARALRKLGKPLPPVMHELPRQVDKGLAVLAGYQHDDGGWGWWKEDDTDPFLTGYVVYGLGLTIEAGYPVDRQMLRRGLRSVQYQFQQDAEVRRSGDTTGHRIARVISPDTRAWMMLGYATAMSAAHITPQELQSKDDYLTAVFNVRDKLSNYSLAALATAVATAGHRDTQLAALVTMLEARVKTETTVSGPGAWWQSLDDEGSWRNSDVETTALAVQALLHGKPNSPLILPALRWLLNQREGDIWQSTKDTAQVVLTLADYLQISPELAPNETVTVRINGQAQKTVHFTPDSIWQPDQTLRLDGLNDDAQITFERTGQGAVYYTARLTAYTSNGLDTAEDKGFKIERHYSILDKDGAWQEVAGPIPNGALVRVELRIQTTKPRQYILIEDPLPSGFEAREEDDEKAWTNLKRGTRYDLPANWSQLPVTRRETRDDRVALFCSELWGGVWNNRTTTYIARYILRPEQTGTRTALPARMELMYRPDINGRSAENQLDVGAAP